MEIRVEMSQIKRLIMEEELLKIKALFQTLLKAFNDVQNRKK